MNPRLPLGLVPRGTGDGRSDLNLAGVFRPRSLLCIWGERDAPVNTWGSGAEGSSLAENLEGYYPGGASCSIQLTSGQVRLLYKMDVIEFVTGSAGRGD